MYREVWPVDAMDGVGISFVLDILVAGSCPYQAAICLEKDSEPHTAAAAVGEIGAARILVAV